ncbi:MAG: hypothetical protein PVJ43_04950, partial [Gemmatimonadales bacterium]
MHRIATIVLLTLLALATPERLVAQQSGALEVGGPRTVLTHVPFDIFFTAPDDGQPIAWRVMTDRGEWLAEGSAEAGSEVEVSGLSIAGRADLPLKVTAGTWNGELSPLSLPGWFSILPPLLAIALALIFREVVISLFAGIWLGAFFVAGLNPLAATLRTIDTFIAPALGDPDHAA